MKNIKKIALTSAMVLGTIASTSSTVFAADTPMSKDTTGVVKFTTPKDGALTLVKGASFDFGSHEISGGNQLFSDTKKDTAQVSDLRGTNAGWTVSVKQTKVFTSTDGKSTLPDAILTLGGTADNGTKVTTNRVSSADAVIWSAAAGNGGYDSTFTSNESSKLQIPEQDKVMATTYTADLTWTLSDAVPNA